jgi:hypothetical protein
VAGDHLGERALARAVRAHERVDLAVPDDEIDTLQDVGLSSFDPGAEAPDLQQRLRHAVL